jgi:BirA family biotin operon repressor/biotin-[acetyl-CoA-carboxylase] ligase
LAVITGLEFDKDELLLDIITNLEKNVIESKNNPEALSQQFVDLLYKKDIPMPFINQKEEKFMGIIQGISSIGRLRVLLEDDSVTEFDIKEIQMLY